MIFAIRVIGLFPYLCYVAPNGDADSDSVNRDCKVPTLDFYTSAMAYYGFCFLFWD